MTALTEVDMSSVPGCCSLKKLGTVNSEIFKYKDGSFDMDRIRIVYQTVKYRYDSILKGEKDLSDPLYVFIKPEAHKESKLSEGRLRLIAGVSLIDNLIDRVLFRKMVKDIQNRCGDHPIAVGWSPVVGSVPFHMWNGDSDSWFSADKSHWDWSVQKWLVDVIKHVLQLMAPDAPKWWVDLVNYRFVELFNSPIWEFQDGYRVKQKKPGIIKSGCYLTIWINSIGQLILHHLVCDRLKISLNLSFMCLGDDTIQILDPVDEEKYVGELENLGFVVKVQRSSVPEFCGFHIHQYFHVPAYVSKHIFLLRHLSLDPEIASATLASYQLLYANHPTMLRLVRDLAKRRCLPHAFVRNIDLQKIQYP